MGWILTVLWKNYKQQLQWSDWISPCELSEGQKPTRIWNNFVNKPENQNLPIPRSIILDNTRKRIWDEGVKRIESTTKLVEFNVGDLVLIWSK